MLKQYKSTEGEYTLDSRMHSGFLPDFYARSKAASSEMPEIPYHKELRPSFDIRLEGVLPGSKKPHGMIYFPGSDMVDIAFMNRVVIYASTVEKDSATGTRREVLATLNTDGISWYMHVNSIDNLAIDPKALLECAEQYAAKSKN